VKNPDFPFEMRPVRHSEGLPVTKPQENLTFSDDNSDSDQNHGEQKGGKADLQQTVPQMNHIY
jgi:hypothetical protein